MVRRTSAMIGLLAAIACSKRATEAIPASPSADAFAGVWRSVTPSLEFVRLSIVSKSSEQGALAARLTLSGVAWEGSGRIAGDSLVFAMVAAGTMQSAGVIVARVRDGATLAVQMRPASAISSASPVALTLVREN
ncbi:MAG: hypothetical protein ACJ79A_03515 [Gemmatimonadaceae bacterium]